MRASHLLTEFLPSALPQIVVKSHHAMAIYQRVLPG